MVVSRPRDQSRPVGRECQRLDRHVVPGQAVCQLPLIGFVDSNQAISATRCQYVLIRRKLQVADFTREGLQLGNLRSGLRVPQEYRSLFVAGCHESPLFG